jgi:hypothetical protein
VGKERGEFVESAVINRVALEFLELHRTLLASGALAVEGGAEFFDEHLRIELENYKRAGLGYYSQKRLDLFG